MTAREGILQYVLTLLSAVPGATVVRSREAPIDRPEGFFILLKPEEEPVELRGGGGIGGGSYGAGVVLRNLTILITVVTRGTIPDQLADPIIQAVHAAVMADRTLGGRCAIVMEHSTKWDFEVADATALGAEMRYVIRYQTSATDLSQTF
jgi:hypothetical protein